MAAIQPQPEPEPISASLPVRPIPGDDPSAPLLEAPALCLSGGGSRAMLFHVGALWRMNELGLLRKLSRVSSVSGGSITAGVLGTRWSKLAFDPTSGVASNFEDVVAVPIRQFATRNLDVRTAVKGLLPFGGGPAEAFADALRRYLFDDATLQDLPVDPPDPRFIINATNLQSGVLWRFSRPYARDWRVGAIADPTFSVATAVAASSAFPPFFAPLTLDVTPEHFVPGSADANLKDPASYQRRVLLADGGVYDNLGLEPVLKRCRTVFVSDGGGKIDDDATPSTDWARGTLRVMKVIDNQVRDLRKRSLIAAYRKERMGAYWGLRSTLAETPAPGSLPARPDRTRLLAEMPTRLTRIPDERQRALINWGYAIADAAIRARYRPPDRPGGYDPPAGFPLDGGVG
jgi:NTE family protein